MKIVAVISALCSLTWMSAVFAGDTVSLTVSTTNKTIEGQWDNLSGQGSKTRYIRVTVNGVKLGKDTSVLINEGASVTIEEETSYCNADCELNPELPKHKVKITGTYSIDGSGSGGGTKPIWDATGYTKANIELTIDVPPAVRRRYGNSDPGDVTKFTLKGTKDIVFTLTIETISGKGEGEAAFDTAGTKTKSYTGTGAKESLNIIGLKESTVKENIKITGTYENKKYPEKKFIVFSKIEFPFNSAETQHKDTAASCTKCANQPSKGTLWEKAPQHVHFACDPDWVEVKPSDHESSNILCEHCTQYCARCCLKVKYGGNQDDYIELDKPATTTVEENHRLPLSDISFIKHALRKGDLLWDIDKPPYDVIYDKLLKDKSYVTKWQMALITTHAIITHGCEFNKEDGNITKPKLYAWNPQPIGERHSWINLDEIITIYPIFNP